MVIGIFRRTGSGVPDNPWTEARLFVVPIVSLQVPSPSCPLFIRPLTTAGKVW